jgi:hypothetical protein
MVLGTLILGYLIWSPQKIAIFSSRLTQEHDFRTDRLIDRIERNSNLDVASEIYAKKAAAARHYDLINLVAYTCLDKYRRDDCVVNLIKCGPSCKTLIPHERFAKIEADYWAMIDERQFAK